MQFDETDFTFESTVLIELRKNWHGVFGATHSAILFSYLETDTKSFHINIFIDTTDTEYDWFYFTLCPTFLPLLLFGLITHTSLELPNDISRNFRHTILLCVDTIC